MPMKPEYIDSVGETGIDPSLRKHTDILERLDSYQRFLAVEAADEIRRLRAGWKKEADTDCNWALEEVERLRTERDELLAALRSARSVIKIIKSGEPWIETCEQMIDAAIVKAQRGE